MELERFSLRLNPAPNATAVAAPNMVRGSGTGVIYTKLVDSSSGCTIMRSASSQTLQSYHLTLYDFPP